MWGHVWAVLPPPLRVCPKVQYPGLFASRESCIVTTGHRVEAEPEEPCGFRVK